jgi:hypothetical protein
VKHVMRPFAAMLLICAIAALSACGGASLPKPNTPQQAGVEALVAYGLAGHVAGQYLALPVCTNPLTAVPCKTADIAARVAAADTLAYNAAVAADAAVNDTTKQQAASSSLKALQDANGAANGGKQP